MRFGRINGLLGSYHSLCVSIASWLRGYITKAFRLIIWDSISNTIIVLQLNPPTEILAQDISHER